MEMDKLFMNFSEEHELNSLLSKLGKRQTAENRELLKELGKKCKEEVGKRTLKREIFEEFLSKNKAQVKKLEDKK